MSKNDQAKEPLCHRDNSRLFADAGGFCAGRKLSTGDIEHYHKIVVVINETVKIMAKIDEGIAAHNAWPIK